MSSSSSVQYVVPLNRKLMWSAAAAALFIAVSLPQVYSQTSRVVTTTADMCPTPGGKFIHTAIFFAVSYFLMKLFAGQRLLDIESKAEGVTFRAGFDKMEMMMLKRSFMGALLFFMLSSTDSYRLTQNLVSGVANEMGCPEVKGVLIHGLVFMVIVLLTMTMPME